MTHFTGELAFLSLLSAAASHFSLFIVNKSENWAKRLAIGTPFESDGKLRNNYGKFF